MIEKIFFILKLILPNFFIKFINRLFKRNIVIEGNYKNWPDAIKNSLGYGSNVIFKKSKESFLKVINGKAQYERDSVLFYTKKINNFLINILFEIKNKNKPLKVLDFGGSFGSTYFQNYSILSDKKKFHWSIIEQPEIVQFANKQKLNENLNFFSDKNKYIDKYRPDVILFSSVVQYLQYPFNLINFFIKKKINYFIFMKTPFEKNKESIRIQIVPKNIYDASYPIRIFNENIFLELFKNNNYKIIPNSHPNEIISGIVFKHFIFKYNFSKK